MVTNTEPGAMTQTVETMLDELPPLTGQRAVLAAMARQLAASIDGMDASMSARMSGQTAGQLLKVLDKLGAQRRDDGPVGDAAPTPSTTEEAASRPLTDAAWYPGFEDSLYAEKLSWCIQKHARKTGLPVPGTQAYARNPWAVDTWQWVAAQKQRPRTYRPLAGIEGDKLAIVR